MQRIFLKWDIKTTPMSIFEEAAKKYTRKTKLSVGGVDSWVLDEAFTSGCEFADPIGFAEWCSLNGWKCYDGSFFLIICTILSIAIVWHFERLITKP